MAFCGKTKDIDKACDSSTINANESMLLVRLTALSMTKNVTNPLRIDSLEVIDPDTGVYPLPASAYYPVKASWLYNSLLANYEVVEGTSVSDLYKQTLGPLVISDSETAEGKANVKALNANMWAAIVPMKGTADEDSIYHVFGASNGLKFLPQATAVEFGNRVVGNFTSIAGGEEPTPNGLNYLDTDAATTKALFNNRLAVVGP